MPHHDLFGPLAPILADPELGPTLTDLIVGPHGTLWVDIPDHPGLRRHPLRPLEEEECRALAVRLVRAAGGRLDDAHPWADAMLPWDNHTTLRLHAVLHPLAHNGTTLSLRFLRSTHHTLPHLVEAGMLTHDHCARLVRYLAQRRTILISGATGVGKTTLLGALVSTLPSNERLVCIEDTAELNLPHPQLVQLVTRDANTEGVGEVLMSVLLRQSLRMRPDRIIVGEVRGEEVVDLLTALTTGHHGSLASIHANNAAEVPQRLLTMALGAGMPETAARHTIASALDVVVHLARDPHTGKRYLQELCTAEGNDQ